jgi:hypothetical protein
LVCCAINRGFLGYASSRGGVHAIKFKGILRTIESAMMAMGLPLDLDKRFVLSINGIRLPWGRYSLPDSTCLYVGFVYVFS